MTRRRTPQLLSDAACAWLRDWLVQARDQQAARTSDHPKRALQRELHAVLRLASDLRNRLSAGPAAQLLDEALYQTSDLRPTMLHELEAVAAGMLKRLGEKRTPQPVARAADLYLHLLYRNGSRWPVMRGNDAGGSAEVEQFAEILADAGAGGGTDRARKALTAARLEFDRQMTPDLIVEVLRAGL